MRKVLPLLFVLLTSFVVFSAAQPQVESLLNTFILEKVPFEITGTVKEVVYRPGGFGYLVLTTDETEVKVPVAGKLSLVVKPDEKVTVKGSKITAFIPTSLETNGYRLVFRNRIPKDVQLTELKAKIKSIEVGRNYANIVILDENNKEYKFPANFVPFWRNLKEGDEVKISGFNRTFEIKESITVDGKTYTLPAKERLTNLSQRTILFNQRFMPRLFRHRL
ncbi:hypothetical protein QQE94_03645 [Fervidobacterium pennivorans subsp. shakshaketiis]|nr:hypothetical protein [Fervidobacterium pennivorans]QIV78209.1 hypothetical protein HER11_03985 [Fervidobacterium pennivorans subsp. keratinolyticus]